MKLRAQTADDGGLVPVLAMECRGLEPIKWHPTGAHAERLITRIRFGREAGLYSAVVAAFGAPAPHGYRGHTVALACSHRRPV